MPMTTRTAHEAADLSAPLLKLRNTPRLTQISHTMPPANSTMAATIHAVPYQFGMPPSLNQSGQCHDHVCFEGTGIFSITL